MGSVDVAGEIATAYLALVPTMRGMGTAIVQQGGPQIVTAGRQLGERGGAALGASLGGAAARTSLPAINQVNQAILAAQSNVGGWLSESASMAVKNVALYGSMYAAIQGARRGIDAMFDSMVGFNAELEQAEIGFTTLTGSQAAARKELEWIKDFAKESPFQYDNLVGYSLQLLAFRFNSEMAHDVIIASGNAAAALGRGEEGIARINLALGQMWTKGKVQSQEMLQLTEAGIGAWQILAKAYGASVAEIQDAVTADLISAHEAVPALIDGMEAQFGGLMEAQSKTFAGVTSNIQDTVRQQFAEAGEPLFRELQIQAEELLDALDDPEAVEMMRQLGEFLANGAHALGDFLRFAWQWRDVILSVGVGYASLKLASGWTARHFSTEAVAARESTMRLQQVVPALAGVRVARAQNAAAEGRLQAAMAASTAAEKRAELAMKSRTAAAEAHRAAVERVIVAERIALSLPFDRAYAARNAAQRALTAAAAAETSAIERSTAAKRAAIETNTALATAQTRVAATSAAVTAAQSAQSAAWARLNPVVSTGGFLLGAPLLMDGYSRSAKAATDDTFDLGQAALGMGQALGGGALAGAAFGSILPGVGTAIGAVGGAVAGVVGNLWSMQAAAQAAVADVSAVKDALIAMGVEARVAELATSGLTNEQLAAIGGFDAVAAAMRSGTYVDYVANVQAQSDALHDQIALLEQKQNLLEQSTLSGGGDIENLTAGIGDAGKEYQALAEEMARLGSQAYVLDDALRALGVNSEYLADSQEQIVYAAYQAAFAADIQTGALGRSTEAAWQAIAAQGSLGIETLQAAIRMEGLAGVAGYATQMITGIPAGTQINFTTNAADIMMQIAGLVAARDAVENGSDVRLFTRRIDDLKGQLAASLQSAPSVISLPSSSGRGSGRGSAADAAKRAAEEAARQLERDRQAQLRFGDAFGAIMQNALEGNFEQYRDRLEQQITSLTRDGYTAAAAALRNNSAALTQAALDYSALTNKLKTANDAYDSLTDAMRDQYTASRDLLLGLGKATDAQSYDQLLYLLGETTNAATEYQDVLRALKEQGLSEEIWNQLAKAGPESMGLAQSILAQGAAGIEQLNAVSDGLLDAADSMGTLVSESMYQQGVDAMNAYIEGLESQAAALEAQLATIANNVLDRTAGAITPGNAGYSGISAQPKQVVYQFGDVVFDATKLRDLDSIQGFIAMLESAATTHLVNQAGMVTS